MDNNISLEYQLLKEQKHYLKKKIGLKLDVLKTKATKQYRKNNKVIFNFLDYLVIVGIVFNLGAMVITNAMVVKENPTMEFKEANIMQCKLSKYECGMQSFFGSFKFIFTHILIYGIVIWLYISCRNNIKSDMELFVILAPIVTLFVTVMGWDFFNDFGYYLGRVLFG